MEREQAGPPSWAWDSGPTEASRSALPEAGRNSSACSLAGGGPGSPPRLPTTGTPSCSSYCASLVGVHTDSTLPQQDGVPVVGRRRARVATAPAHHRHTVLLLILCLLGRRPHR